ncbi:hypothetical protein [Pseudoduganella albidiflava]|uniref:3-oxoacyl-ACP synthase n=1 Tax=Pseudoduganella albidiflava TaxID=321983 RepID=A0A411X199_9BURK|nr:hypothetical protein [Pseudoduganella albidiflava]QBI02708.1 hypothetical protein EYF70_19040 [Pseudoduganella albidiflava]GGY68537.1 hypothetical protein GCM10007387_58280 [Pseudoduganella albidiflava]
MGTWMKGGLAALVVFGLCWGGAIAWWQGTGRSPSNTELAGVLLAAPLALLAALLLVRHLRKPAAPEAAAGTADAATPAPPVAGPSLALLATALSTPHGAAAEELAKAIVDQLARSDLDPELLDDDGYPVMSVRVEDPAGPELREAIALWLGAQALPDPQFGDEHWRALGMVTGVAADLAHRAGAHPHALPEEIDPKSPLPTLQILLALTGAWNEAQRSAAGAWIGHVVAESGWPASRISTSIAAQPAPGAAVSNWLIQLTAQAAGTPTLAMLLSCDSQIGEASVNALAAEGRLFGANRQQGLIPGEGAAGLLLADATQAALFDSEPVHLHTVAARRDDSADVARKPDAALLRSLGTQACTQAAIAPAKVAVLLADTGHRTSRLMELMELANQELAQLDAGTDVLATGSACGHAGAVPFVTALALAHQQALERQAPVLCVSNEDPHYRSAVLVRPPVQPA